MTTKDSVVKLFVKFVPLTFMALSNLNSMYLMTVFVNSNSLYVYLSHAPSNVTFGNNISTVFEMSAMR